MRIEVFGDSHVGGLERAYGKSDAGSLPEMAFRSNHGMNIQRFRIDEVEGGLHVTADNFPTADPLDITLTPDRVWIFSGPLHSSRFSRSRAWRGHCHWRAADRWPALTPVSGGVFEAMVEQEVVSCQRLANRCAERGIALIILEPPLLNRHADDMSTRDLDLIADVDHRFRVAVKRRMKRRGAKIIETSSDTNDGDFMLPEYCLHRENDTHHGNRAYCQKALQQVLAFFADNDIGGDIRA